LLLIAFGLLGCDRHDAASSAGPKSPGRYAGIGTFEVGRMWREVVAPASQDPAAAKLTDDEHVIVVLDSHTGEVRQCGDHSGFCVAMNPWATGTKPAGAPVKLAKHADELDAEADKSTTKPKSDGVVNETAPAHKRRQRP
jgi:hypothetical protein